MPSGSNVLLIDDDPVFSASVATLLQTSSHYEVTLAASTEQARLVLGERGMGFDAILLDIMLPGQDGIAFCNQLRGDDYAIPIILLTGSDDESMLVRGLQAGADDFVRKPFRGTELLARLQARIRAFSVSHDAVIHVGRFVFHPGKRTLFDSQRNDRVPLAEKEARLLWHLYHGNGEVLSRTNLLHAIWGYSRQASTHTVETHIYRLRQKIEEDPARPRIVITERGGYRLARPAKDGVQPLSFPLRQLGNGSDQPNRA